MTVLDDVLTEIKTVLRAVDGLRNLPDEPPDTLNTFPAAVVYPTTGRRRWATAYGPNGNPVAWVFHTITIDLYVVHGAFTGESLKVLRPFTHSVPNALMHAYTDNRFGGLVTTLGDPQDGGVAIYVPDEHVQRIAPGEYVHDIVLFDASGNPRRIAVGTVTVERGVTRV